MANRAHFSFILGCLGSLGVSEDVLVKEKAGLEFLRNILTRLVEIEDEGESIC